MGDDDNDNFVFPKQSTALSLPLAGRGAEGREDMLQNPWHKEPLREMRQSFVRVGWALRDSMNIVWL